MNYPAPQNINKTHFGPAKYHCVPSYKTTIILAPISPIQIAFLVLAGMMAVTYFAEIYLKTNFHKKNKHSKNQTVKK